MQVSPDIHQEFLQHPKYQAILKTAQTLFWKHGIKRVSVQEICKTAGTSKMTFYKFFDNKIALAKTILDLIYQKEWEEYIAIMEEDIPYPEKVKKTILAGSKQSQKFSEEFILDIYRDKEMGLLEYVNAQSEVAMERVLDDFEQAQKEGYVRPDIKRAFIRYQMFKMQEVLNDEALIQAYDNLQELITELTNFFFYGLLTPNNT